MKKLVRSVALLCIAAVFIIGFSSCSKQLAPKDVFEKFSSDNAKAVLKIEFSGFMIVETVVESDGAKCRAVTTTTLMGQTSTEEVYMEVDDGKIYEYTKQSNRSWTKTLSEDQTGVFEELEEVFNAEHYNEFDEDTNQYTMRDGVEIEADGMIFSKAIIEIGEDSYTFKANVSMSEGSLSVSGNLTMTVSDFGKMSVTLPSI